MRARGTNRSQYVIATLAVLGTLLNVWALTVHTKTAILAALHARSDHAVICHGPSPVTHAPDGKNNRRLPKSDCPICSGFTALHIAIIAVPLGHGAPAVTDGCGTVEALNDLAVDHRPREILNRGPPLEA